MHERTRHGSMRSQVNVRIDANMKTAGDAALAAAGITPTQAVRMLWSLAVCYQDGPKASCDAPCIM